MIVRPACLLAALLSLAALAPQPAVAQADQYPSRNLSLVVGFPAGSGMDVFGRFMADRMGKALGKPIIVENKPGALSHIASEYVTKQKPDGYTIYITGSGAVAPVKHLFNSPNIDPIHDLQYLTTINRQAFMVVVDPKSSIKTLTDLTALWKQKAGKASYGTTAIPGVVLGALYRDRAKLDAVDVPFRTSEPALNALLAGDIDAIMADPQFGMAQIANGKLRPLAFASPTRFANAPDIPTMIEQGFPGIDLTSHLIMATVAKTPRPVVQRLHDVIRDVVMSADGKEFVAKFGGDPMITTPEELVKILEKDEKAWGEYVKIANIPKIG